ncbi:uncharacterized protein KY384_006669 [Bacidia gigantensis]|uniref:uncharacterized protein n=1 Tax=Bacidia gigantensis TaxID=2732470 RepID=UPI001D03B852|nr:uncharacterized protein KY384_006669 [Bacidia gigantensis]KAG8528980.1 hypothetical protein KY384_006669 [Bacidia gigantensis]
MNSNVLPLPDFHYSGNEPPTPTRTPTSPSFFLNSFETPKQDYKPQDTRSPWGNAFANALSPSFKTPNLVTFSPSTPTHHEGAISGKNVEAQIATHEQLSQISNAPAGFEEVTQHVDFSLDPSQFTLEEVNPQDGLKTSIDTQVSSAGSIQTPPPTGTSASKRNAQQAQAARLAKENTSKAGRRMSFPASVHKDQASMQLNMLEGSPLQFPPLQFSPDNLGFPHSGPATAPAYPQHKLFWDPDQNAEAVGFDMPMDDPLSAFGISTQQGLNAFTSQQVTKAIPAFPGTSQASGMEPHSMMPQASHPNAFSHMNTNSSIAMASQGQQSVVHRGLGVNPNLLFSSSNRPSDLGQLDHYGQGYIDENLQPYAQQLRDAQMEQEYQNRKQKRKRPPELGESPAVKAAIESLREDRTDSSKSSPVLDDSYFGALPNGPPQLGGDFPSRKRMTPDNHYRKNAGPQSLHRRRSNKTPAQRTEVTLEIDETGRAITKTSIIKESRDSPMDEDSESQDSDSSSGSEDEMVLSHHQSFMRPPSRQKSGRTARFAGEPYSHSQRSSDASTLASGRTGSSSGRRASQLGQMQAHSQSNQSFAGQDEASEVETVVDSDDDRGEAQAQLKKVVNDRSRRKSSRSSAPAMRQMPGSRRQSQLSEVHTANPYFITHDQSVNQGMYPPMNHSSPTTITDPDFNTPNSRISNASDGSTRCVCNVPDGNGQLMIQW